MSNVFTPAEIDRFIRDGYIMLRNAFPSDVAARGRDHVWTQLQEKQDDPSTWTEPMRHLQTVYFESPFDEILNDRIRKAVDELTGAGRADPHGFFGWWPVLFPGFEGPGGWHVDGSNFQHRLCAREQALVTLYLFSDIGEGDGGTAIARGSHHAVARIIADAEPAGLDLDGLMAKLPAVEPDTIEEVQGRAGDIAFLHPFLIHGFSANRSNRPRFACNPQYMLKTEKDLNRADGDYSPVEAAIRVGLGLTD